MYLVLLNHRSPLAGLGEPFCLCATTRPTSNESCTFSPSCAFYCLSVCCHPSPRSWLERNTANYPSRMRIRQKSLRIIGQRIPITKFRVETGTHNEEQQMAADCPVHPRILSLPVSQAIIVFLGAALQSPFQKI